MDKEHIPFFNYDVLAILFRHVDYLTLRKCAQVCSLWKDVSVNEKKRRRNIYWVVKIRPDEHSITFEDPDADEETNIRRRELSCKVCSSGRKHHGSANPSLMEDELFNELKNIPMQPVFCMAFMTVSLFRKFPEYFPSFGSTVHKNKKQKFCEDVKKRKYFDQVKHTAVKDFLPENCPVAFAVASEIVGCYPNCKPVKSHRCFALSGIFIPEVTGVKISHFRMMKRNYNMSKFLAKNAPVKCILIFLPIVTEYPHELIQSCCVDNENIKMVVVGAFVEYTECLLGSAVVFSGSNVEAASLQFNILEKEEQIVAKFKTFQETGLLNHMCFAYVFGCFKRGLYFCRTVSRESEIFCKMYPNIPVIGIYTTGRLPYFEVKTGGFVKHESTYLPHESSVFVLISLKIK
ncbi:hypothetical protein NPIL_84841 [Nephila pilipes]|uniref:F-box domain-containing protein n=1 Tax=Nephila pilipes TaxID=299642 RepID=A0A8X6TV85_NEPPI|nr:hypothetical protein NPIL_84841 [Nephila pilipes]